jgi:hypothetical protein
MLELGPHPVSIVCRLLGAVKEAGTAVGGEITLSNGVRFFSTWMSSMVCERGTASLALSTGGGYSSGSVHVLGQDGEAFVDLRRNTLRVSEKNRYIRAGDLVDGMRNGLSVAQRSLWNFLAYGLGATGLRKPHDLQETSVKNSLENFYEAVRCGHAPTIGADEGTAVVEACALIVDGARLCAAEGTTIAASR